jgi:hypothetical protein
MLANIISTVLIELIKMIFNALGRGPTAGDSRGSLTLASDVKDVMTDLRQTSFRNKDIK